MSETIWHHASKRVPLTTEQQRLVESALKLAYKKANEHRNHRIYLGAGTHEDVEAYALYRLVNIARAFDPTRGVKFLTYAARALDRDFAKLAVSAGKAHGKLPEREPFEHADIVADERTQPENRPDMEAIASLFARVQAYLDSVDPKYFVCLKARILDKRSLPDIAQEMGVEPNTIRSWLYTAKKIARRRFPHFRGELCE